MLKLAIAVTCAFAAFGASTAEAHNLKKMVDTFGQPKYGYGERLSHKIHHVIRATQNCQSELQRPRAKNRGLYVRRSVQYRRYVLRVWLRRQSRCADDLRSVRAANLNWWLATTYADKVFPGVRWWLIACSSSEGGHTIWVSNRQGSGAGGWMQFMSGTFYSYVDDAFRAARSRGFYILTGKTNTWRSWKSPAGQAITAGYMRWSGRYRGHWTGSRC